MRQLGKSGVKFWDPVVCRTFTNYQTGHLTKSEYCRVNNIALTTFYGWEKRAKHKAGDTFVQIPNQDSSREELKSNQIEIITVQGLRIKLPDVFDKEKIKELVEVLREL